MLKIYVNFFLNGCNVSRFIMVLKFCLSQGFNLVYIKKNEYNLFKG